MKSEAGKSGRDSMNPTGEGGTGVRVRLFALTITSVWLAAERMALQLP
jgi:hypothetical protein